MEEKVIELTLEEALGKSSLTFEQAEIFSKLGITPTKDKGITISVCVPYPCWCDEERAKKFNAECYRTIDEHRDLFKFVRLHGYHNLEEVKDSPYTSIAFWVRINHISGQNLLVVTHGHGPDRGETYYRAKNYDEFWDIVSKIKRMSDEPYEDHEPIMLEQNNEMCGNSFKKWKVKLVASK